MRRFGSLRLLLVAFSRLVTALSASHRSATSQGASVRVEYNSNFKPNPASHLRAAYRKHKVPVADGYLSASVPAFTSDNDVQYLVPVDIGTPPQRLNIELDTGSRDLWVYSSKLPRSVTKDLPVYSPSKSQTSQRYPGETWDIQYGADERGDHANGSVYWDQVSIGGLAVKKLAVGAAEFVSSGLANNSDLRGIMGLGAGNISSSFRPDPVTSWLSNIQGSLKEPLFTANLNHLADGNYNFGYIDSSEHCGPITYTPVKYESLVQWGFDATSYAVGDGPSKQMLMRALADTGSSLLLLDDEIAEDYYGQVEDARYDPREGAYVFPCSAALPDFTFGISNSTDLTIPGDFMNFRPAHKVADHCFGGIQNGTGGGLFNVFGNVALKAALVVFDVGNKRVGWAPKRL